MGVIPEAWSVPNVEERTGLCRKGGGDSGKGLYLSKDQIPRILLLVILSPQQNNFSCIMPKYEKLYPSISMSWSLFCWTTGKECSLLFFTDNSTVHHKPQNCMKNHKFYRLFTFNHMYNNLKS